MPTAPEIAQVATSLRAAASRALGAVEFGVGISELEPERGGLGMDAVGAADRRREFEFARAALQRGVECLDVGDEQIGGADQLHVKAGVKHVGRRHALMHETRLRPDDFRQMGEEGDDVVLGLALDFVDARDIEPGVLALGPDCRRRGFGNDPELGHGVGGMRLDFEPDAKARLRRPDRRHFRPGVARDHTLCGKPRAVVRLPEIDRRSLGDDAGRIDACRSNNSP